MSIGGGEEAEKASSGGFQFDEEELKPCFVKESAIKVDLSKTVLKESAINLARRALQCATMERSCSALRPASSCKNRSRVLIGCWHARARTHACTRTARAAGSVREVGTRSALVHEALFFRRVLLQAPGSSCNRDREPAGVHERLHAAQQRLPSICA